MIYKKDGKILVKDGKLCSTCCPTGDCPALPSCLCDYADDDCVCWNAGETPKYLVVTFAGIKKCSDDSLWTAFNASFCLTQTKVSNPTTCTADADIYALSTTIDGNAVIILYQANIAGSDSAVTIYTSFCPPTCPCFFDSAGGDTCVGSFTSNMTKEGCSEDNLAYDGTATLCNPCTGTWL